MSCGRKSLRRGARRCRGICLTGAFLALASAGWAQQAPFTDAVKAEFSAARLLDAQSAIAQPETEDHAMGSVQGVVVNRDGVVYEGAHISLTPAADSAISNPAKPRETTTDSNGRFYFDYVPPGTFKLTVSSNGFANQVVSGVLAAGQSYEAKEIVLTLSSASTEIDVTATRAEIATEELKLEETQRVLGVIPNFYVTYVPNAPPLTRKQKYSLAWKSSIDPVTILAVGFFAGVEQADNSFPGYGQGAQGYAKRFGAGYADSFIGGMIGGAILPAWWKQDPRYFYKGTGTARSRIEYAIANAVVCKGDNGHWQANYSAILGGLAAGGISNLYYPPSDRGASLIFKNALVNTGMSAVQNLIQEFVVRKLTPHVPNYGAGKP